MTVFRSQVSDCIGHFVERYPIMNKSVKTEMSKLMLQNSTLDSDTTEQRDKSNSFAKSCLK